MVIAVLGQLVIGFIGAIIGVKSQGKDIDWIKAILNKHDRSIDRLHARITDHVSNYHREK